jgi:hypothetical protein
VRALVVVVTALCCLIMVPCVLPIWANLGEIISYCINSHCNLGEVNAREEFRIAGDLECVFVTDIERGQRGVTMSENGEIDGAGLEDAVPMELDH